LEGKLGRTNMVETILASVAGVVAIAVAGAETYRHVREQRRVERTSHCGERHDPDAADPEVDAPRPRE
jgi:hypothetical protein